MMAIWLKVWWLCIAVVRSVSDSGLIAQQDDPVNGYTKGEKHLTKPKLITIINVIKKKW